MIINNRECEMILSISLGSKSSCMLAKSDGTILNVYKEESFTLVKNDSSFPMNSINNIIKNNFEKRKIYFLTITITHWFNSKYQDKTWERYYIDIKEYIKTVFKDYNIVVKKIIESNNLHDCLMSTAKCYSIHKNLLENNDKKVTIVVANRFGNYENCISTYTWNNSNDLKENLEPETNKLFNLENSLGLFQQIISKKLGFNEYDIYNSSLTLDHAHESEKTRISFDVYNNKDEWINHKDKILDITKYLDNLNKKDIYDYRPIDMKNLLAINNKFSETYMDYSEKELLDELFNVTYNSLNNLLKDYKDHKIIVIGDCFINSKINNSLNYDLIVCPYKEDNCAIFGACDKVLEKIFYNRLKLDDDIVYRYISTNFDNSLRELDYNEIENLLNKNYIVNVINFKTSFYENYEYSMSLCKSKDVLLKVNSFHKDKIVNEIEFKGTRIFATVFSTKENVIPIDNNGFTKAMNDQKNQLKKFSLDNKIKTFQLI